MESSEKVNWVSYRCHSTSFREDYLLARRTPSHSNSKEVGGKGKVSTTVGKWDLFFCNVVAALGSVSSFLALSYGFVFRLLCIYLRKFFENKLKFNSFIKWTNRGRWDSLCVPSNCVINVSWIFEGVEQLGRHFQKDVIQKILQSSYI